jgi:GT2 family glycosyltransferase
MKTNDAGKLTLVTVVIVNWELPQDTIQCVASLRQSKEVPLQILVVDNGSRDNSVKLIQSACPEVQLVELPENLGFSGGYNAGIQEALKSDATHLFIINNDTVVDPDAITYLVDSDWDIAIPKILFLDEPDLIWSAGARWRKFPPSVAMVGYLKPDDGNFDQPHPLDYATSCALLVKREVFDLVFGFDEDFRNYADDYDFFYRVRQAGFRTGYVPKSRIYHAVSASLGEDSPQKWWFRGRNTVLFYRKNDRFPRWMLWFYLIWVFATEILKGNAKRMDSFWSGIKEGRQIITSQSQEMGI